jgi:peptidoglycan/LPS O-acetylase OafA/YrhL
MAACCQHTFDKKDQSLESPGRLDGVNPLSRNIPGRQKGYIPTLDGWRAIAIVLVLFAHSGIRNVGIFSTKWLALKGEAGVDIFFAISGLLICSRLLDEEQKTGTISLRNFYLRRLFRIQPAASVYLVSLLLINILIRPIIAWREWLSALLMFRNYTFLIGPHPYYFVGHFWSLAMEEHFYLILPSLLLFTPRLKRIRVLAILAGAVIANRAIQYHFRPGGIIYHHTDIRLDALIIPALVAVALYKENYRAVIMTISRRFWFPVALILAAIVIYLPANSFWHATGFALLVPFAILATIFASTRTSLFRFLEWGPLRFVGRISYSIYLWQMLFFTGDFHRAELFGRFNQFPYNLLAVLVIALGSYYLVEKPAIRWGHRLTPKSPQLSAKTQEQPWISGRTSEG